jgi:hypothetical protein
MECPAGDGIPTDMLTRKYRTYSTKECHEHDLAANRE